MTSDGIPAVAVSVDRPADPCRALDWAAREAMVRDAPLLIVTVSTGVVGSRRDKAHLLLQQCAQRTERSHPGLRVTWEVMDAEARRTFERRGQDVQLLVVGARSTHRLNERLFGSTAVHTAAAAVCPVVVVPENPQASWPARGQGPIVLGLDEETDHARAAMAFAFEAAVREDAELRVVHAWQRSLTGADGATALMMAAEQDMRLHRTLAPWRAHYPEVDLQAEAVYGGTRRYLQEMSQQAGLVVVGRRGRPTGPLARLHSVGQSVLRRARCPVAVIPAA
ncbi:universal stress protein [Streptacidiphilus rugosus]|uniref:universal stress protein n=1 Tax=Streptacidiphilus rugosus TaxID=405783 RepID=UPI00055C4ADD|nr:universal stress protein [Streptacidiphilus rugosus]